MEHPADEFLVGAVEAVEHAVGEGVEAELAVGLHRLYAEQLRAEHGGQRYGRDGGGGDCDADNPPQLLEEDSGHPGDEGQGEEHGDGDERRHDDGEPHGRCAW